MIRYFNSLLRKEHKKLCDNLKDIEPWLARLSSIRQSIISRHKRKAWESNSFTTVHKNWNAFLVYSYRNLVVKNDGRRIRSSKGTFENTVSIWHNRLRGHYNTKGLKQERERGKELTPFEREWRVTLMRLNSSMIGRRRLTGWIKTIDYSIRYIRKAEKRKLGGEFIKPPYLKVWGERLNNIREQIFRKHIRHEKGWDSRIERTVQSLVNRERIKLGVLNYEQSNI